MEKLISANSAYSVAEKSQPDVVTVTPEPHGVLLLEFETGEKRRLDITPFVARGGAYELLAEAEYFRQVRIVDGGMALGWPGGQEVYPEALFEMSVPVVS